MTDGTHKITIPRHNPVNAITMAGIVKDAGLSLDQFRKLLSPSSPRRRSCAFLARAVEIPLSLQLSCELRLQRADLQGKTNASPPPKLLQPSLPVQAPRHARPADLEGNCSLKFLKVSRKA